MSTKNITESKITKSLKIGRPFFGLVRDIDTMEEYAVISNGYFLLQCRRALFKKGGRLETIFNKAELRGEIQPPELTEKYLKYFKIARSDIDNSYNGLLIGKYADQQIKENDRIIDIVNCGTLNAYYNADMVDIIPKKAAFTDGYFLLREPLRRPKYIELYYEKYSSDDTLQVKFFLLPIMRKEEE